MTELGGRGYTPATVWIWFIPQGFMRNLGPQCSGVEVVETFRGGA